jgi:hypothetical protein
MPEAIPNNQEGRDGLLVSIVSYRFLVMISRFPGLGFLS